MDGAGNYGICVCSGTMSAHLNVSKPLAHRFTAKGTRVELHPATDEWMQGDRYGEIVGFAGRNSYPQDVKVKLDKSGRVRRYIPNAVKTI